MPDKYTYKYIVQCDLSTYTGLYNDSLNIFVNSRTIHHEA